MEGFVSFFARVHRLCVHGSVALACFYGLNLTVCLTSVLISSVFIWLVLGFLSNCAMSLSGLRCRVVIIACAMKMVVCVISQVIRFLHWTLRMSAPVAAMVPVWCAAHFIFMMAVWSVRLSLFNISTSGWLHPDASSSHSVYLNFN